MLDVIDRGGYGPLKRPNDALLHLFGVKAGVAENRSHHRDVNVRKDVGRSPRDDDRTQQKDYQRQNDKRIGTIEGNPDNPHGGLLGGLYSLYSEGCEHRSVPNGRVRGSVRMSVGTASQLGKLAARLLISAGGVALVTLVAHRLIPGNPTTVGFAYLLFVLIVASTWGFVEACFASILATLTYNFFFLPPVGQFTIADPQNWVALFTFLATSLIASRLSDQAKHRAMDAVARQQDLERLYTFSRAILLIEGTRTFPKQLAQKLAEIFGLSAVVLFDRRADEMYLAGPSDFDGMEDQLRESALNGTSFADPSRNRVIAAVRLGSEPIASLALQGAQMPDSVLQGIANLVAIGLERAKAQDLTRQIEVARQSEQLADYADRRDGARVQDAADLDQSRHHIAAGQSGPAFRDPLGTPDGRGRRSRSLEGTHR